MSKKICITCKKLYKFYTVEKSEDFLYYPYSPSGELTDINFYPIVKPNYCPECGKKIPVRVIPVNNNDARNKYANKLKETEDE